MEGARGVAPDVRCYNAALHACAEGRLPEEALALLKRMEGRRGLAPDAVSYNTALTACAKGLRHTEGLAVLDEMRAAGVKPDAHTYSAALACCDDAERANELLAQMRAVGVEPDGVCYGAAIAACARGGEAASADALLREQARRGVRPTVVAHKAAIAAFAREGDWRRALELLDDLEADEELRKQMGAETFVGAMQAVEKFGAIGAGLIGPALFQASMPAPTAAQPPQLALAAAGTGLQPFDGGALPFTLLAAAQLVVGALLFGALRRLSRAQMERDRASDTSSDAMDSEDASAI